MTEEEKKVTEQEEVSEEELSLVFPTATIVREMKKYIDPGKMIKKEVKIAMNKFLAEIVKDVSEKMNEFPYAMLDYRMFKEAVKPYEQVKELHLEKDRIKKHLDAIISDCESLKRDLEAKFGEKEKI